MVTYKKRPCDKTKRQDPNAWDKDELIEKCKEKFGGGGYSKFKKEELCEALSAGVNPRDYNFSDKDIKKSSKKRGDDKGESGEDRSEYTNKKVTELREILRERGKKVSGTKAVLIDRILRGSRGSDTRKKSEGDKSSRRKSYSAKSKSRSGRGSNDRYTYKYLEKLSEIELKTIASNYDINTSQNRLELIEEIFNSYKENEDPQLILIDLEEIPKKYRKIYLYLKSLDRQKLKNINAQFKRPISKSNFMLIFQILQTLQHKKLDVTLEDLEALADKETVIKRVKEKIPLTFKELYLKMCEVPTFKDQYNILHENFTKEQILELSNKYKIKIQECNNIKMPKRYSFNNDNEKRKFIEFIVSARASNAFIDDPRNDKIMELYEIFKEGRECFRFVFTKINSEGDYIVDSDDDDEEDGSFKTKRCIRKSKLPLTSYQQNAINFMKNNRGLLVYFETGTGKTLTAIAFSQCILNTYPDKHIVIITTKSVITNFRNEITKYGADPDDDRYEFYTYDQILHQYKDKESIPNFAKGKVLIIDEAQNLRTKISTPRDPTKEMKGKIAQLFIRASKMAFKVMLLTATPFINTVQDGFNLVQLLKKESVSSMKDEDILRELGKMTIYQGKLNDADFPAYEEHNIHIEMDSDYYRYYKQVEELQDYNYKNPWVFLTGVRRAMNTAQGIPSQKIIKTYKIVKKSLKEDKKCLIFTNWIKTGIDLLVETLEHIDDAKIAVITGSVSKKNRDEIVKKYNKRKYNILIISSAGGEGLDLKEVETLIVVDVLWSDASKDQVIGRAIRKQSHINLPPERRKVNIYSLYMIKPATIENGSDELPSADEIMSTIVDKKTEYLTNALETLQRYSIENGISEPQVRASHDSLAMESREERSSLELRRGSESLAKYNSRRNS